MAVSAGLPWWTCVVEHSQYGYQATVTIYQFGILKAPMEVAGDITPPLEVFLALAYIAVCTVLLVWSSFAKHLKMAVIPAIVGLSYIAYAWVAANVVIAGRMAELGGKVQGYSEVIMEPYLEPIILTTSLQPAYYLAYAVGIFCVCLSIIHLFVFRQKLSPGI